jgi:hypothetical protein
VDVDEERRDVGTMMRLEDLNKSHFIVRAAQASQHLGSHFLSASGGGCGPALLYLLDNL